MKEYYVSFVAKGVFDNDFKACFISTSKPITEKIITEFKDKIANEVKISRDNVVILGITQLEETRE